jgi:ABC-type nitrate/sulfonate/bicarbonate transport system permease component
MPKPLLVQRAGIAIAALGLAASAAVHFTAAADDATDPVEHQREMREVARLGGTATVRTVEFDQWLDSLWHGQGLAVTLAVLGLVVGGACWKIGGLMAEEDDAAEPRA